MSQAFGRIQEKLLLEQNSTIALSAAPGNVRINKAVSGLGRASVVNVSQVLTLDRANLSTRVKALPGKLLNDINSSLRISLGL
jgi:mRNA interferase MazF